MARRRPGALERIEATGELRIGAQLGGAAEAGVSYAQATALLGYTPDTLLDEIVTKSAKLNGTKPTGDIVTLLLKKRFMSSPFAFGMTLANYLASKAGRGLSEDEYDDIFGEGQADEEEGLAAHRATSVVRISNSRRAIAERAAWTRSGRAATTLATTRPVTTASPIPITAARQSARRAAAPPLAGKRLPLYRARRRRGRAPAGRLSATTSNVSEPEHAMPPVSSTQGCTGLRGNLAAHVRCALALTLIPFSASCRS